MVVALATVGGASAGQISALSRSSTFDSSNEGWIAIKPAGSRAAGWVSAGGNPGGYISTAYAHTTFLSPGTWAGNALGDYGGRLTVDLKAAGPGVHAVIGVSTNNSNVRPCLDTGELPQEWHTYSIALEANSPTGCALTAGQMGAALAGFTGVAVVAPAYGPDPTVSVDNVSLTGPQTPITPPTGTITRELTLKYIRGANAQSDYIPHLLLGRIATTEDFSCLRPFKVTIFRKSNARKPVKVGTAITAKSDRPAWGSFSFKLRKVVKGSYYATVTTSESPLDGNTCNAAQSKGVRVR
jgi:hypothetical protein